MSGPRNLDTTLPSPSELDEYDLCQFSWLIKSRQGYEKIEPSIGQLVGKVLDSALNSYYNGSLTSPTALFEMEMHDARMDSPSILDEEWGLWVSQGKELLELYPKIFPRVAADWEEIIAVQPKYEWPCPCRPDLVIRKKTGQVAVLERKMESAWADLEYEKMKYEMSWQPVVYALAVQKVLNEPVSETIMEFNQRGVAASGRYKAIPPQLVRHAIPVENWKADMWFQSALLANEQMKALEDFASSPETLMSDIPRRTRNCVQKLGKRTFTCWLFPSCSVNMHPCDIPTLYHIPEWKKEVKL